MSEVMLDGHRWTDRGDGLYLPDVEYVEKVFWCIGDQYAGLGFVVIDDNTGEVKVIAMADSNKCELLKEYKAMLRSTGVNACTLLGTSRNDCIGGLDRAT